MVYKEIGHLIHEHAMAEAEAVAQLQQELMDICSAQKRKSKHARSSDWDELRRVLRERQGDRAAAEKTRGVARDGRTSAALSREGIAKRAHRKRGRRESDSGAADGDAVNGDAVDGAVAGDAVNGDAVDGDAVNGDAVDGGAVDGGASGTSGGGGGDESGGDDNGDDDDDDEEEEEEEDDDDNDDDDDESEGGEKSGEKSGDEGGDHDDNATGDLGGNQGEGEGGNDEGGDAGAGGSSGLFFGSSSLIWRLSKWASNRAVQGPCDDQYSDRDGNRAPYPGEVVVVQVGAGGGGKGGAGGGGEDGGDGGGGEDGSDVGGGDGGLGDADPSHDDDDGDDDDDDDDGGGGFPDGWSPAKPSPDSRYSRANATTKSEHPPGRLPLYYPVEPQPRPHMNPHRPPARGYVSAQQRKEDRTRRQASNADQIFTCSVFPVSGGEGPEQDPAYERMTGGSGASTRLNYGVGQFNPTDAADVVMKHPNGQGASLLWSH